LEFWTGRKRGWGRILDKRRSKEGKQRPHGQREKLVTTKWWRGLLDQERLTNERTDGGANEGKVQEKEEGKDVFWAAHALPPTLTRRIRAKEGGQ